MTFSDNQSQNAFLMIQNNSNIDVDVSLTTLNNQTDNAFDQWDITQGFMGSNQVKQSQSGLKPYSGNIFSNLTVIAEQLFGANSPIVYAIGVIALLTTGYITYLVIKFIRTGN